MVTWNKDRTEAYAQQILTSLLANPEASRELVAIAQKKGDKDHSPKVCEWAERWADIAFDIAEVFAAEASQRDEDPDCRVLEYDDAD